MGPFLRTALAALALALGCHGSPEVGEGTPTLAATSLDRWCDLLEPDAEARAWQAIPWRSSLHEGLADAARAERPLLLWLMNGHPLGCT